MGVIQICQRLILRVFYDNLSHCEGFNSTFIIKINWCSQFQWFQKFLFNCLSNLRKEEKQEKGTKFFMIFILLFSVIFSDLLKISRYVSNEELPLIFSNRKTKKTVFQRLFNAALPA